MLVTFHGCLAMGRDGASPAGPSRCALDRRELHRGGKLVSDGTHPIEQDPEQHLRVEPSDDRVVAVVRESVEAAERLPSLELQLDLFSGAVLPPPLSPQLTMRPSLVIALL